MSPSPPPPRFRHATVVAYLALFLALTGGTAYAAKHYLISSTKQIKPSVRRALRGATGHTGPTGTTGATGPATTVLPSGTTQTGVYFAEGTATTIGDLASASISFPVSLASNPTPTIVSPGTTTASCPGSVTTPSAAPGALCIYIGAQVNVGGISAYDPFGDAGGTVSRYGAGVVVDSAAAGNFYSDGTWAVGAP
jgi:hypothetical protein